MSHFEHSDLQKSIWMAEFYVSMSAVKVIVAKQLKTFTAVLTRILHIVHISNLPPSFLDISIAKTEKTHKGRSLVQALFLMDVVCLGEWGRCVISSEVGFGSNWHWGCKHEASNQCCSGQTGLLIDMPHTCVCNENPRRVTLTAVSTKSDAQFLLP